MNQHHKHTPKLLALACAAIFACAMLPVSVLADEAAPLTQGDSLIVVNGTAPYTLDWSGMNKAFQHIAEGGTVQLGGDITLTDGLTVRKSCTFDLNGHTITLNHGPDLSATGLLNSRNLFLTIEDTAGNGQMRATGASFAIILWENSSLTVSGGTLSARGTAIIAAPSTTVIINGGSLSGDTSAIRANTDATVTINGDSLTSPSGRTVHMNTTAPSIFTMTGGTVSTQTGEALHLNGYCTSNLSGGTVEATASDGVAIFSRTPTSFPV